MKRKKNMNLEYRRNQDIKDSNVKQETRIKKDKCVEN